MSDLWLLTNQRLLLVKKEVLKENPLLEPGELVIYHETGDLQFSGNVHLLTTQRIIILNIGAKDHLLESIPLGKITQVDINVIGMTRRGQDLTRDANLGEQRTALREGDGYIALQRDVYIMILRLGELFHQRDCRHLGLQHEQTHASHFELLCQPGVIDVVVSSQRVADLLERDIHLVKPCPHAAHRARVTQVHQQARAARTDHPVVGGKVSDIHDGER